MAVRLRLRRMGRKKSPFYRIVAADQRSPRDGRFIEILGSYNPLVSPHLVEIKEDRIFYWLDKGAQPSDTVRSLLKQKGILLKLDLQKNGLEESKINEELKKWELLQVQRYKRLEAAALQTKAVKEAEAAQKESAKEVEKVAKKTEKTAAVIEANEEKQTDETPSEIEEIATESKTEEVEEQKQEKQESKESKSPTDKKKTTEVGEEVKPSEEKSEEVNTSEQAANDDKKIDKKG